MAAEIKRMEEERVQFERELENGHDDLQELQTKLEDFRLIEAERQEELRKTEAV